MNVSERREGRAAIARLQAGDRSGALAILRRLVTEPHVHAFADTRQLVLAFMEFRCERLNGQLVQAHVCVARQKASDIQRTQDTHRGEASEYPSCVSSQCAQGRAIRRALDPKARMTWVGAGPGGRFQRERSRKVRSAQEAARARLERVGMLERPRTLDIDADPVGEDG